MLHPNEIKSVPPKVLEARNEMMREYPALYRKISNYENIKNLIPEELVKIEFSVDRVGLNFAKIKPLLYAFFGIEPAPLMPERKFRNLKKKHNLEVAGK